MPSFDIVSELNLQEVDNAVNQSNKEISTRFDFKNSKSSIQLEKEKLILVSDNDQKMESVKDILMTKMVKRGVSLKALDYGKLEAAAGSTVRLEIKLIQGIETSKAKEIVKFIKDEKYKVNSQIQDEQVRVTGKSRDELQAVMAAVRGKDFDLPLQFINFRD
ncbi:MAG: YajQ family cyclic di-GMP-binding protein [Deltaproteobacteria bacterium]|nr:YajQ family cyclic di-GMP-binding protein [Deltaproteobacteria bacterium]